MVKILQAYNFAKQNTYALNGEILSATLINSNRIAISSAEQFIEIYDISSKQRPNQSPPPSSSSQPEHKDETVTAAAVAAVAATSGIGDGPTPAQGGVSSISDERLPTKYTLATVGEVVHLIYCEAGKYLLTLEKENVGSPVHSNSTSMSCTSSSNSNTVCSEDDTKMFVRIYANFWKFPESKLIDLPITIRIASMTTPKVPLVESIDVIELPLRSPPDLIQCCQTSGNIIVSSKDRIYLYEYALCVHENTQPRFSFIDFLPFKFFVNLSFVPLKLNLTENVIACMNNRYCVAFRVVDVLSGAAAGNANAIASGNLSCLDNDYDGIGGDLDDADEPVSSTESSIISKVSGAPSTHSHNSYETDSFETTSSGQPLNATGGFAGRTPVDFNVARMMNSALGREFEVDIRSQWDQNGDPKRNVGGAGGGVDGLGDTQDITITPTRANEIKIKLVNEAKAMNVQRIANANNMSANDDPLVQYDVRKLLQICMKTSEPNSRVIDILRCMDLKAIYQRSAASSNQEDEGLGGGQDDDEEYDMGNQQVPSAVTTNKHANRRTLKSKLHHRCVGYALLVASSVDGYLYQFCAQGKWYNENEKPVAIYSFTAPVLQVHINDYVVYAVTNESVETHTSRIGHKLFNNRFEYPSIGALFPEESSPDVNAAIAVVGLCSFMQVQYVCVNREHLVLISNSALNSANSGEQAAANKRRSGGGEVTKKNIAARLIAEAKAKHSLLRSSSNAAQQSAVNEWTLYNLEVPRVEYIIDDLEAIAESYRAASSSNFYDLMEEAHVMLRLSLTLQCEKMSAEREQELRAKFMENCRKLADFSIRSSKKEVYLQATGFYKMCNLHLVEIYNNYITNLLEYKDGEELDGSQLVGLIYTVKLFLLSLGTNRLKSSYLNQTVTPFFTPNLVVEQGCYKQVPLSLEFLNMFIKYSPADIAQIMLSSPVVADSMSGELINYLKYLHPLPPDESLLLAVTACRMSNYLLAQGIVSTACRQDLAISLIKHKNVLFDDSTMLYQKQRNQQHHHQQQQQQQQHDICKHFNNNGGRSGSGSKRSSQMRRSKKSKTLQQMIHSSSTPSPPPAQQINNSNSVAFISFSDFCETILLTTEQTDLIEAISDAFIHALCIERSITLDVIVQLFLNYIASHIGQKGYQTSQKVFVNILQVYYYDLFDVSALNNPQDIRSQTPPQLDDDFDEEASSSKEPSLNSERDNDSLANSIGAESNSCTSSSHEDRTVSGRQQRIIYDQLQEQQSPFKRNSNSSLSQQDPEQQASDAAVNLKGLKILFRMYMGRLKAISDLITDLQSADLEQQAPKDELLNLRMESITYMMSMAPNYCTKPSVRAQSDSRQMNFVPFMPDYKLPDAEFPRYMKTYTRPIPCLLERPQYLNRLPPFERGDFTFPNKDEGEFDCHFIGWHNELLTLTLKIQSLLASPKIDKEIITEFLAFIQKTPNLIGIDSFLVIILPKNLAINYLLSFCPQYLWQYGKSCGFTPKHWESLLRKLLGKQETLPNWKENMQEILNNLVTELPFEELLQCFPSEVIKSHSSEAYSKEYTDNRFIYEQDRIVYGDKNHSEREMKPQNNKKLERDHYPMDNIDESNVFELTLRKAVAKQRSIALRSMIESTGTQLFDATNNPMYNL